MKNALRSALLLLLAAALPLGSGAAAPASAGAEDFLEDFERAMRAGDETAMAALVAENQDEAVRVIVATCEAIAEGTSEELERRMAALRGAWREAFDTRFAHKLYEYFSLISPEVKRARAELMQGYRKAVAEYEDAVEEEAFSQLPATGLEFEGYGLSLEELGDLYHASNAWLLHAWCFEERYLGDDANIETAYVGFSNGIRLREEIGLEDSRLRAAEERLAELEAAGVSDPETEFVGSLAGKAKREAEAARATTVSLSFQPVEELDAFERPYYGLDEIYQAWEVVGLGAEGSTASFAYVEDSPVVIRTGPSEAMIDEDGDGEGDVEIPLTGTIELVELRLGRGDALRPWAFLATIGEARDRYQGFDCNLEPDMHQMSIYVAPAASIVGTVAGKEVRIFDDNMDGIYGSEPQYRVPFGTDPDGSGQGDFDSILVEGEERARPWSRFLRIDDVWYELEMTGPTELRATPRGDVATATLELDYDGASLDYLIVGNLGGRYEGAYFDLVPGGKRGTTVPVGEYFLCTGKVSEGKRRQIRKAVIVPPQGQDGWRAGEGRETTVTLGEPFGLDFELRQDDTSATVVGKSVFVTGSAGETYERLWNCVLEPEVAIREEGARRASEEEEMRVPSHQDDISEAGSFAVAWFPFDLTLPKEKEGETYEAQLIQRRHDLFGKLESEWRR